MGSKVESESYIPVGSIYFEEREDGLLHEKEILKRTMLQHELTFKNQVHELHRLYRVQRDLMQEYQQNNNTSQTNSFSSQNPTNNNTINNNNFEFIREDSVQSSSKNLPIIPIQNQNQNRNVSNISSFGRREIVDLNEDVSNISNIGKKGVLDLNEDANTFGKRVLNGSGLDFMGVNKRVGFDEGSGSGSSKFGVNNTLFPTNNNNNNPFPINSNLNNNNLNNSFYMNFKPAQQSIIFPNQFSINPQLFPQSLTINFDPSQINNNNENNNNNNNNANNNNNVSYPVLDSSPHYINLDKNKNKSPIPSFIHTVPVPVPVFNNGVFNAGTNENLSKFVMDSANSSFYFSNSFSKNPTHSLIPLQNSLNLSRNPNPTSIFGNPNPNSNSKFYLERNSILNLNEPAQDGTIQNHININNTNNNNNKGVKIFGANCEKSKETNNNRTFVHESNIGTKLLGFPVFTNPSSNSSNEIKSVPDLVTQKPESESGNNNKRTGIDLNETYYSPQENNNNNTINNNNDDALNERNNKGKKPIISFDLNEDLSSSSQINSSELEAAHNILTLSSKTLNPKPSPPLGSDPLSWFADLAVASHSDPFPDSESDTDSYEQMVLNLQPITTEDRFGPDKYKAEDETGETGQEGFGCMLYSKGKRGPARKRRQKRDFQRDVLPALASLSRVEVSEDLQLLGGLVRASGQEFDMAVTRRVGRSGSNRRRTAPPPAAQTGRSDPPRASTQPSQTGRSDSLRGSTQSSWNELPRGSAQGSQTGRNDSLHGSVGQAISIPVGIPPRFSLSQQMGLVRVDQVRGEEEMNLVHVNQQMGRPQESQIQQNAVIGWEKFTRRARRPRGPAPAQHHHHHQQQQNQQGNNNNNDRNNSGGDL